MVCILYAQLYDNKCLLHVYMRVYIGSRCSGNLVQDIVFVIQASYNTQFTLQQVKEFVATVSTELLHNSPQTAVGVIVFSRDAAYIHFNLQAYSSLSTLVMAINELPYFSGSIAHINKALTLLVSSAYDGTLGLRNDSSKVAIIITDERISAIAAHHSLNVFDIYVIGPPYVWGLIPFASSPEFVDSTSSFFSTSLQKIKDRILPEMCNGKESVCTYVCRSVFLHEFKKAVGINQCNEK